MSIQSVKKINQKDYLKKYLSGDKKKKKKHKKQKDIKVKIIDDDANIPSEFGVDEELLLTGEDAPQIVATYIEDKPHSEEKKWKSIVIKDEQNEEAVDIKPEIKLEEDLWGPKVINKKIKDEFSPPNRSLVKRNIPVIVQKSQSKSERSLNLRRRSFSVERTKNKDKNGEKSTLKVSKDSHHSGISKRKSMEKSSLSRNKGNTNRSGSRSSDGSIDQSPPRRRRHKTTDQSSPRRQRKNSDHTAGRKRKESSSDQSPPRQTIRKYSLSNRSPSQRKRKKSSTDQSPQRRKKRDSSADQSPRRSRKQSLIREQISPRRRKHSSTEESPFRHRNKGSLTSRTPSPHRRRDPSVDQSPQRRRQQTTNQDSSHRRRERTSATRSPHRSQLSSTRKNSVLSPKPKYVKREKQSRNLSPARNQSSDKYKNSINSELSQRIGREQRNMTRCSESPPPTHATIKTLDGKRAGLQDAQSLLKENQELQRKQDDAFEHMSNEMSGRGAEVQVRSIGRRGKRAIAAQALDPEELLRKEEHEKKKKQLYDRWGKGLKQIEDYRAKVNAETYEGSKPLARYSNDADLEQHLREQERVDDPMLEYMRKKRKDKQKMENMPRMPTYQGPFPENRFGIRPGYRWDGVDRSNGYEEKWFKVETEKRAIQDEAYKYSVEDM